MPTPSAPSNAVALGKGTLVSRLLGFARDAAIAALLGGGATADAFLAAFRIPNITRAILAEGALAYSLVPAHQSAKAGPGDPWRVARSAFFALVLFFAACAFAGVLFSDQLARLLAPGFVSWPESLAMTSGFLSVNLAYLPLCAGAATSAAILMAEGRFAGQAYFSAVFNTALLAATGVAFLVYGGSPADAARLLCAGVVFAGAAQFLFQTAPLARLGFSFRGPLALGSPAVRDALRAIPGAAFGVGGHHVNILIATVFASFLAEGAVSALYFAERLIGFPLGVIAASVGLAALADLSGFAYSRKREEASPVEKAEFADHVGRAARVVLFFALPAAVGTACLAYPITDVVFGRGAFGPAALDNTAATLLAYVAGLPALAAARPLLAALGALGDAKTPVRASALGAAATVVCGGVFLMAGAPSWSPALAVSAAAWASVLPLLRALARRGLRPLPPGAWLLKAVAACGCMAACVLPFAGMFAASAAKLAAVPLGVFVYFAAARLLRVEECSAVLRAARRALRTNNAKGGAS